MINRSVKKHLLQKLNISSQALSQRAKKIKTSFGPMSTEEAVYVIAHQEGIDLSRILSIEVIDKIRSLVPKELPKVKVPQKSIHIRRKKIKISQKLYPLVPNNIISRSVSLGNESFPQVFILENSIRNLIINKLNKTYGRDWWLKSNIKSVRDTVQRTIDKEKKYPHREKRGLHEVYYSNFADLKQIILNERRYFNDVIVDFQWFEVEMNEVYMARNMLAHSVVISEDDISRIRIFYRDWSRLLESAGYK